MATTMRSPEQYFGHVMGEDRKIARWDRIVDYLRELASASDRMKIVEMGKSTEGHPFLLCIISSPANLARLEELRRINLQLSDPRGITEEMARKLSEEGKAVVCQSMSLHGNEIGGTQMVPELTYELLSGTSEDVLRVLDNVVFLMIPCFNPDGQVMTTDWYDQQRDTPYEGAPLPWLYQKYTGHDNNRDAYMMNLVESQYVGKVLLRDWIPQVYQDHHHMGPYGPRLYIAPYSEPIRPYADPIVWREIAWYGSHMSYDLEEQGKQGVIGGVHWSAWGHLGYHRLTIFHNIAGLLTESASALLAKPIYIHPQQLKGTNPKTHPNYEAQTNFPNPWPGGWWRLRDIVEQQKITAWAILDICARYRQKVLWNAYLKAKNRTLAGKQAEFSAYAVPTCQHDPSTAERLVKVLLDQGIEMFRAQREFDAGAITYRAGTVLVPLAQPKYGMIRVLLDRTVYPDAYWTRNLDGTPMVYDLATDTVAEYLGVKVEKVCEPVDTGSAHFVKLVAGEPDMTASPAGLATSSICCTGSLPASGSDVVPACCSATACCNGPAAGYILDGRRNDAFFAVNALLKAGAQVWRIDEAMNVANKSLPAGAFWVSAADSKLVDVHKFSVPFIGSPDPAGIKRTLLTKKRIGVYQRFWGGNMDEGWTRLVLEKFGFDYESIRDEQITSGNLAGICDVLVLPSDSKELLVGPTNLPQKAVSARSRQLIEQIPPEYHSGFGADGMKKLREFVEAGGTLVALANSCNFAIEALDLKMKNAVAGLDSKTYYCQGSTLRTHVKSSHPLGYGMPEQALVLNVNSPVFEIVESFGAQRYEAVVEYADEDVLQSGWIIGASRIHGKPAMVRVPVGRGSAVLIGFPPQFRGQTYGTFKFLFNAIL